MTNPVEIRVLGPFEVLAGGQPKAVSGSKRHGLLALLALRRGRVVEVDALIDALWDDELPAAPRNAVQHHVARLRAVLGPQSIVASPNGYALKDATVDALRFEELLGDARAGLREGDVRAGADSVALALTLWRGPALHGLRDTEWFSAEAQRLEALRVDALEEQYEAALALGEHREIVSALRATLEENPFRERLWGQLMLALYRSGRQADALQAFQEARHVLLEELALEPGPELRRLQEAILAQDPAIAPVPVAQRPRGNLPSALTSFVGRESLLGEVERLLRDHRLVTLTGPPGVGKTRLALEAAHGLEADFEDGVWHVDLRRANSTADVPRLVVSTVQPRRSSASGDVHKRLMHQLRDASALIVLDECERFVADVGRLAATIIGECPRVRVLATSRELLRVPGEHRIEVGPLQIPRADTADELVETEAVQLFIERARAARPGFGAGPGEADLVGQICRIVDGLPAAIELAAARVHVLGLREILSSIERRLDSSTRRLFEAGEDYLATLVGWSYDLLHADEKALLQQLSIFRGGADRDALLAMSARLPLDETTVTSLLATLVEKSIVSVSFVDDVARYDLLTLVRQHVQERMAESGELAAARKAHAEYFATVADAARTELRGPRWLACTRRLGLENDNLWAALTYADDARDSEIARRLGTLGLYFALADRVSEGRRFLELALAVVPADGPIGQRLELVPFLCYLMTEELDLEAAVEIGERALAEAAPDATPATSLVKAPLALAYAESGDEARAAVLAEEAYLSLEKAGDDWGVATAGLMRAMVAARAGDVATVAAMAAETYIHAGAIDFEAFQVPAMLLEAWVGEQRTDFDAAEHAYRRTLELAERTGFLDHAAYALSGLASTAFAAGNLRDAEELQRRALATAEAAGAPLVAALARVELARVLSAAGDMETAERLYRTVLEWSGTSRSHQARESVFLSIADNPAHTALLGLAEIAEGRGDPAAAADFRERAGLLIA